jgi:hypothetical protein
MRSNRSLKLSYFYCFVLFPLVIYGFEYSDDYLTEEKSKQEIESIDKGLMYWFWIFCIFVITTALGALYIKIYDYSIIMLFDGTIARFSLSMIFFFFTVSLIKDYIRDNKTLLTLITMIISGVIGIILLYTFINGLMGQAH